MSAPHARFPTAGQSDRTLPDEVFHAAEHMLHILETHERTFAQDVPSAQASSATALDVVESVNDIDGTDGTDGISEEHTIGASLIVQSWLVHTLASERNTGIDGVLRDARRYLTTLAAQR